MCHVSLLDLLVMFPSMFSGAALWLIVSRWGREKGTTSASGRPEEITALSKNLEVQPASASALTEPDLLVAHNYPSLSNPQLSHQGSPEPLSTASAPIKMVRCNCGLELPEDSMVEHADSTGHSKPFNMSTVKIGKIWDLEEAVIENAS